MIWSKWSTGVLGDSYDAKCIGIYVYHVYPAESWLGGTRNIVYRCGLTASHDHVQWQPDSHYETVKDAQGVCEFHAIKVFLPQIKKEMEAFVNGSKIN